MQIGFIGLGKMGCAMVARLLEKGHEVVAFDQNPGVCTDAVNAGVPVLENVGKVAEALATPRVIWVMVPHTAVDGVIDELTSHLAAGDIIIDGGNSLYTESQRRAGALAGKGIEFLDAGVSGGPYGARNGAAITVGGSAKAYEQVKTLLDDLSAGPGSLYTGPSGSGHFVKMVHNGIEYGMMQAIAEGFSLMKESPFNLDVGAIAAHYQHGSVIESRLVGWLARAYQELGNDLEAADGSVAHTGEGQWTIETARSLNAAPLSAIEAALQFRIASAAAPSYRGKILTALRHEFGGHPLAPNQ